MPRCFVITGYGIKKDYINNRDIDLDKSFKYIIKPVFEELGYECKRSCDYPPGIIDSIMYKGIYDADFVIADISTLNPNALYELGVRHALKPFTTLVICEDGIFVNSKLPFDLSHLTALPYHHDGKSLDIEVVENFKVVLKNAVTGMMKDHSVDSPVFAHIQGLSVIIKTEDSPVSNNIPGAIVKEAVVPYSPAAIIDISLEETSLLPSLTDMIEQASALIKKNKFDEAIIAFRELSELKPGTPFFIQQLCLATYKSEKPDAITANKKAYEILEPLNPLASIDTETLGMAGAIHKNLFRLTGDKSLLEKSLRFYERGYYISNDYYNGINTAFLYWQLASLSTNKEETIFYKMQAARIARHVVEICNNLRAGENYSKRNDREWIINTLAEALFGLDETVNFNQLMDEREKTQNSFSDVTFKKQLEELKRIKEKVGHILETV